MYLGMFLFIFGAIYCVSQVFAIILDRPFSFLSLKIYKLSWVSFFALFASICGLVIIRRQGKKS
ncbi:hypothetical protein D3C87_677770 [compost metagenome]